jgi:hypothetical protein
VNQGRIICILTKAFFFYVTLWQYLETDNGRLLKILAHTHGHIPFYKTATNETALVKINT